MTFFRGQYSINCGICGIWSIVDVEYDKDIRSREVFLDVVFAELVLELLLQVLLSQFFIRILLDQNGLLQIVHYLQNQDQLLLTD